MTGMTYNEQLQLLQEGRIGHLQFVMNGELADDFLRWCKSHGVDPSDETAEFFIEQTESDMMDHQEINNENDGIWL